MVSISEAAEFIRYNCLKDWTLDEIKLEIIKAINNNTLIYSTDEKENLIGICIAEDFKNERRLHVKAIVANKQLNRFIAKAAEINGTHRYSKDFKPMQAIVEKCVYSLIFEHNFTKEQLSEFQKSIKVTNNVLQLPSIATYGK